MQERSRLGIMAGDVEIHVSNCVGENYLGEGWVAMGNYIPAEPHTVDAHYLSVEW